MSVTMAENRMVPDRPDRELMPGGIALSVSLHIATFALILLGLPSLFHHPPPEDTPIAVSLVTIAPETRATQPNPFRPKPEAKPEAPVAAPAPKPAPKPVEAQAPPPPPARPPEPRPKPEPQQAAHAPRPEMTKTDPKAFDKLLK